jgi:hypothetical protein
MYMALLSGRAKLFDAYTVVPTSGDAVGLCDGYAYVDEQIVGGTATFASRKAARERAFPRALIGKSLTFDARNAQATSAADKAAIIKYVGEHNLGTLNTSVSASFAAATRDELLRRGQLELLELQLRVLQASRLRKLAVVVNTGDPASPNPADPTPVDAAAPATADSAEPATANALAALSAEPAVGADPASAARALGSAMPATLEEVSLSGVHAAALDGVCALLHGRRLRKLELIMVDLSAGTHTDRLGDALRASGGGSGSSGENEATAAGGDGAEQSPGLPTAAAVQMVALVACTLSAPQMPNLVRGVNALSQLQRLYLPSIGLGSLGA